MARVKLTKSIVEKASAQQDAYELRDTVVPGFLCKMTPAGKKVFMVQYRTSSGVRRKPSIGVYGELTVEQARSIAQDWLAEVRRGLDPSAARAGAREAPLVRELCERFMAEYSVVRNKPSTVRYYRYSLQKYVVPTLGHLKVCEVSRADIADLMKRIGPSVKSNRVVGIVRRMFTLAEVWALRPDGSNPCRHIPKFPERGTTRCLSDDELKRVFCYLERAGAEGLEHPTILLAVRLQFALAARMSEVLCLEWDWIDWRNSRIVWPDSKTGSMSKPMSKDLAALLDAAPRFEGCPYVLPSIFDRQQCLSMHTYAHAWRRILESAGVPHVGTHGVRHRAATDIANSGVPLKVGMRLTGHRTVTMFMRYVHPEDAQVHQAAETVSERHRRLVSG